MDDNDCSSHDFCEPPGAEQPCVCVSSFSRAGQSCSGMCAVLALIPRLILLDTDWYSSAWCSLCDTFLLKSHPIWTQCALLKCEMTALVSVHCYGFTRLYIAVQACPQSGSKCEMTVLVSVHCYGFTRLYSCASLPSIWLQIKQWDHLPSPIFKLPVGCMGFCARLVCLFVVCLFVIIERFPGQAKYHHQWSCYLPKYSKTFCAFFLFSFFFSSNQISMSVRQALTVAIAMPHAWTMQGTIHVHARQGLPATGWLVQVR